MLNEQKNSGQLNYEKIKKFSLVSRVINFRNYGISNYKKTCMLIILVALMLLILPTASAFANTFLQDKTMELYKGEIGEYCVYLQNTGKEDLVQMVKILGGAEFVKNLKEVSKEFNIPAGTFSDDMPVCMEVKLPRDAEKKIKYTIEYGVTSMNSDENSGMVSFAPVRIREKFYLTEKLEPKESKLSAEYLLLGFAFVVLFAIMLRFGFRKMIGTRRMQRRKIKRAKSKNGKIKRTTSVLRKFKIIKIRTRPIKIKRTKLRKLKTKNKEKNKGKRGTTKIMTAKKRRHKLRKNKKK